MVLGIMGEGILEFILAYNLVVANTFFKRRDSCLVTYKSEGNHDQIEFILTGR